MIHQGIKDQVQYKVTEMQENVVGYGLWVMSLTLGQ